MINSFFLFYLTLVLVIISCNPEVVGQWQAKRDIAYKAVWEETVP
jgi:hypothetical protein